MAGTTYSLDLGETLEPDQQDRLVTSTAIHADKPGNEVERYSLNAFRNQLSGSTPPGLGQDVEVVEEIELDTSYEHKNISYGLSGKAYIYGLDQDSDQLRFDVVEADWDIKVSPTPLTATEVVEEKVRSYMQDAVGKVL